MNVHRTSIYRLARQWTNTQQDISIQIAGVGSSTRISSINKQTNTFKASIFKGTFDACTQKSNPCNIYSAWFVRLLSSSTFFVVHCILALISVCRLNRKQYALKKRGLNELLMLFPFSVVPRRHSGTHENIFGKFRQIYFIHDIDPNSEVFAIHRSQVGKENIKTE